MNKRQLIVAWVAGIIMSIILLAVPKVSFIKNSYLQYDETYPPVANWSIILNYSLIILIIGGLLIYTLRDKK